MALTPDEEAATERTRRAIKRDPLKRAHIAMEILLLEEREKDLSASRTELEGHLRATEGAQTGKSVEEARLKALELLSQGAAIGPEKAQEMEELRKLVGRPAETAAMLKLEISMFNDQLRVVGDRLGNLRPELAEIDAILAKEPPSPPGSRESVAIVGGHR